MSDQAEGTANTISAEVAARLIKVTPRRLQQLVKDGWITRQRHGRYTVVGVVHGYLDYRDDLERRRQVQQQDTDLRQARQREIEQRMAIRDARLIAIEEHDAVFDEAIGMLKSELLGLPARISRRRDLRGRIESEIDGVLNRAADRFEQATQDLRATGRAPAPAAEDDAG